MNPDKVTNPAQTLEEYYDFLDWAATCMPWNILKDQAGGLCEHIDQSLDYFYSLVDQPLEELEGQGYCNNSLQYVEPYRSWMKEFVQCWGEYLSTEDSWSEEYYELAYADPRFGLQNGWYEDPSNWHSFNDFFSRYLSSGSVRPIAAPGDDSVGGKQLWDAEKGKYVLEDQDPGWQMIETRGYVIVETGEYGLVAVLPVGMSQVSSVNFEDTVVAGATSYIHNLVLLRHCQIIVGRAYPEDVHAVLYAPET